MILEPPLWWKNLKLFSFFGQIWTSLHIYLKLLRMMNDQILGMHGL